VLTTVTDPILGFIDECSLQQRPNARRVLNTPIINYQPGSVRSKTIFGFMALNGNDEVMISSSSKADDMIRFITNIRIRNAMRPICILLDNARIHIAENVRILAQEIDIHFIYNIPYSPDLNPMENLWGIIVRDIYANNRQYQCIQDLRIAILQAWNRIDKTTILNLMNSMPNRLFQVINRSGGLSDY